MKWYTDFFRDEWLREVDPFGYALGLVLGFVLIPALVVLVVVFVSALIWTNGANDEGEVTDYAEDFKDN